MHYLYYAAFFTLTYFLPLSHANSTQAEDKQALESEKLNAELKAIEKKYAKGDGVDYCLPRCKNDDQDDLFPQGTVNRACLISCRNEQIGILTLYAAPPSPGIRPSGNNRAFILLEEMEYKIGESELRIRVPAGFVTDYASIPSSLWSLYSPHDQYSRAAIVHDYLYWSQLCSRKQADNLFMIAMQESEVPETTRKIIYNGVTAFGESAWKENQRQKEDGLPKVVPIKNKDFPPNWSWEMYRHYLVMNGVKDPKFSGNDYCNLGNSVEVPTTLLNQTNVAAEVRAPKLVRRALRGMSQIYLKAGPFKTPE